MLIDFVLAAGSYWAGYRLRSNLSKVEQIYSTVFNGSWYYVAALIVAFIWLFGGYHRPWRYTETRDDLRVIWGIALGVAASWFVVYRVNLNELPGIPLGVTVMTAMVAVLTMVTVRIAARSFNARKLLFEVGRGQGNSGRSRTALIVGAGEGGKLVLKEMINNPVLRLRPVGFVDDNPHLQRQRVDGLRVHGSVTELDRILEELEPDEIIIAIPSAPGTLKANVSRAGRAHNIPVRALPSTFELLKSGEGKLMGQARQIKVEDVLGRKPVVMELARVGSYLRDKRVLITGAGGSIGSELARQIARVGPAQLVLLDHAEDNLFLIWRELAEDRGIDEQLLKQVICDVKEADRFQEVLDQYSPQIVFHAAAYKHVGLMEMNPIEAVRNNALATRTIAEACGDHGVERFVLISTDKAVAPETVMGASKALAELAVESAAQTHDNTRYASVRFGNVLGSSGSVVPIFQRQIARGGPVTITDKRMKRYFMTIPEAVQLVIQAGNIGRSGEILVLDMGEPVSIFQLAQDMIEMSGLRPNVDIEIVEIGPRPGEKLEEGLFNGFEVHGSTDSPQISVAQRTQLNPVQINEILNRIESLAESGDSGALAEQVQQLQLHWGAQVIPSP